MCSVRDRQDDETGTLPEVRTPRSQLNVLVFTGHRAVLPGHENDILRAVSKAVRNADEFVCGGAYGADIIALEAAVGVQSKRLRCVAVVAATLAHQPADARRRLQTLLDNRQIDLVELGLHYDRDSLMSRNRFMIDHAACYNPAVLAYFTGIHRSGTWSAMSYARKRGIPVAQVNLTGG